MDTELAFDRLHRMAESRGKDTPFDSIDADTRTHVRKEVGIFGRAKSRLAGTSDLYAMLEIVYGCFSDAWAEYHSCLVDAYAAAYRVAMPSGSPDGEYAALAYESGYSLTMGWTPKNEWERKRARAYEAYVSGRKMAGVSGGSKVWDTSRNLVGRQMAQGADDVAVIALGDAYRGAGVSRVRYCAVEDGHACAACMSRDGRTYRIGHEPHLPAHPRCRCWYEPVIQ